MDNYLEDKRKMPIFAHANIKKIMNGDHTERLPQASECQENSEGGILESASYVAHGVLEEIEALAGTTACKSVQLVRLKKWAQEQSCWYDDRTQFGDYFDRGSENEVYLSPDGTEIVKLNDFRYSDDNLTPFFERIKVHNDYFPITPMVNMTSLMPLTAMFL